MLPFIVHCDANGFGIGAVLTQETDGVKKVICYLSRSLTKNERNFSTTERECLAVVWSIEKLRSYLEGSKFVVITDHSSLLWLNKLKDPTGSLARWAVRLQQFTFEIKHRKGREHVVPDALSRSVPILDEISTENGISDRWLDKLRLKIESSPEKFPLFKIENQQVLKRVRSRWLEEEKWLIIPPTRSRKEILRQYHDVAQAGHSGIFKTLCRVRQKYYWPKMKNFIAAYVNSCPICQQYKVEQKNKRGKLLRHENVTKPWETICMDFMGPFP